jgi:type II secretory pathway component GspD/PulD (secretin)
MKAKLATLTLVGLVACRLALAQTNTDAGQKASATTTPASTPASTETTLAQPSTTAALPPTAETAVAQSPAAETTQTQANTVAAQPPTAETAVAQPPSAETTQAQANTVAAQTPGAETVVAQPPSAATTLAQANTAAGQAPGAETPQPQANPAAAQPSTPTTPPPAQPGSVIPLIQFQDVPITTAIENLARQAAINYILDPNVGYGQPDEKGVVRVQPNISIRWENLTAEQALNALLNNYGLQLVEDPKTKIARVTKKDPAAPDPLVTKIVQLKFASPSNILTSVQSVLTDKRSKVVADLRTSQLVVSATEKEQDSVDALVERLDTQTKQVLIEAKLLETSKNPHSIKGIDWSGTLDAQKFTFGNGITTGNTKTTLPGTPSTTTTTLPGGRTISSTATPGMSQQTVLDTALGGGGLSASTLNGLNPSTAFLNADGVSAVLSFINKDSDAQVLSEPRAVTLDNQEAVLSVTRAFPIFKNTAGTQGSPGGSEVTYTNLGTILYVTPRISANDFINLKVRPEVSSVIQNGVRKIVAGVVNEADIYDIRTIRTEVMIPSGNTLVLGGLVSDDRSKGYTKVPLLGDIPLLGLAFRHEDKQQLKKNLMIFITPTVVQDSDFQPTQTQFLRSKPEMPIDEKLTAWDSAKPHDWSQQPSDYAAPEFRDPAK